MKTEVSMPGKCTRWTLVAPTTTSICHLDALIKSVGNMSRHAWVDAAEYPLLSRVSRHLGKGMCCAATHGASQALSIFSWWEFLEANIIYPLSNTQQTSPPNTVWTLWNPRAVPADKTAFGDVSEILTPLYAFNIAATPSVPPGFCTIKPAKKWSLSNCSEPLMILLLSFCKPLLCLINNKTVDASSSKHPSSGMWTNHAFTQLHSVAFCLFISQGPFFIYFSGSYKLRSWLFHEMCACSELPWHTLLAQL